MTTNQLMRIKAVTKIIVTIDWSAERDGATKNKVMMANLVTAK